MWIDTANGLKKDLKTIENYISFAVDNPHYDGFISYEDACSAAAPSEPETEVSADDIWVIMYTGGTTGKPKGVMKSHANLFSQYFITLYDQEFSFEDTNLLVMPCCHINSLFYSFVVTWAGGTVMTYNLVSFDPEDLLKTFSEHKITFTSLVPTQYIMLLALPDEVKARYDVSCVNKLLCSSAPARRDTKLGILEMFPNSRLFEAYGSTEAGMVTILKPHEQMTKLGSIGREVIGSDQIRLYDEAGGIITEPGVVGELYSRSPQIFEGYWKEPEKTVASMIGDYFSAGDMALRDEDGYYTLVDRKANMIISGGENIYPTEVENVVGSHPKVKNVAVIGVPHEKWGEQVSAIVVLHEGVTAQPEEITDHCRGKIAGYKVPKNIIFIEEDEMPMSGPGKILHRVLRERYGTWDKS
jgi:acyl-CoA synthetase (AMP-forming)/AMP-acid ligase II